MTSPPAFTGATLLVQAPEQLSGLLDGEVTMLSIASGEYHKLNSVGSYLWTLIERPRAFADVIEQLLLEFEIDRETCEREARAFIERLIEARLVQVADADGAVVGQIASE